MSATQQKIRIEKNVPMPTRSAIPPLPLEDMEIGDSFALRASGTRDHNVIRQRLHRFQRNNPPRKFSMRTVDDETVRIFRVEDAPKYKL